ncbi:MAG: hypothetical protein IKP69_00270, partial [Oscillospiraceae bacterium]|nr:hypothetical protein [Oscillospiraceae bacterium]
LEEHSVLNLKGCSIIGCSTQQDGGAIRMDYVCELNIQDTGFYVNFTADSNDNCHGGAIYIGDGTATIQNASFEGNYSEDNAGAIYINDGGLSVSKSIFRGNYAKDYGGAVYVDNSYNPVLFSGCTFMENTAEDNGGAVYIDECNQTVFNNCYFSRNTAWDQGGALFIDDDNTAVVSTTITNNTSGNDGSGVYIDGSHIFGIQGKVIIRDNYQTNGSSNNLYLDTSWVGSPSTLTNGGLYDGSDIYLSSTASGRTLIAENFSEFQKIQFLHAETGSLEIDKDTVEKQAERFLASVIGNQNMLVIGIGILMFLIYIIVIIVKNKKMKGMDNRENKA